MTLGEVTVKNDGGLEGKKLAQLQAVLNRYCLYLTGSHWDAEDLAQDTWLKALRAMKGNSHRNPQAFLLRIAKNTWIDHTRRNVVFTNILRWEQVQMTEPDHGLSEMETAFQILLKYLSPLQRTAFLLRDVLGYSNSEAAEFLSTTEGAVKSALYRARQALEASKAEIEKWELTLPEDSGLKIFLRSIAQAYQQGEIAQLVELAQHDVINPVIALAMAQTRILSNSSLVRKWCKNTTPTVQMAA